MRQSVLDDSYILGARYHKHKYPLPFHPAYVESENEGADAPRTLLELKMCSLSSAIREKPEWIRKATDPGIVAKWREEALQRQCDLQEEERLTPLMVDYVLAELTGYAKHHDKETGIEIACWERIWKSDSLIAPVLHQELIDAVAPIENVPDHEKDWHPGSNGQVLDLVHPSLYPLVYRRTYAYVADGSSVLVATRPPTRSKSDAYTSQTFQWLPADFQISADGSARLVSPYINNINRVRHKALYPVIEKLVAKATPMWNRVLSDLLRPLTSERVCTPVDKVTEAEAENKTSNVECIWPDGEFPQYEGDEDEDVYYLDEWLITQPKRLPDALPAYEDALDSIGEPTVFLQGSKLQVIVKLANIVLTPENPEYAGGSWHVEGMLNERIVSTFIYYYDEENLTESRLAFRTAIREPVYHCQDDSLCMETLYGLRAEDACVQDRGSLVTKQNRCIAFPNIYLHQVHSFRLQDATKSGHRKIVALFLVDPSVRIPSTTDVPEQRREAYENLLMQAPNVKKLPDELSSMTLGHIENGFTKEEAEEFRRELMKERTAFVEEMQDEESRFGHPFNLCEH